MILYRKYLCLLGFLGLILSLSNYVSPVAAILQDVLVIAEETNRAQVEPAIAINPNDANNIVVVAMDYRDQILGPSPWMYYYYTFDNWATRPIVNKPLPGSPSNRTGPLARFDFLNDPSVAFDTFDNVYVAGVAGTFQALFVAKGKADRSVDPPRINFDPADIRIVIEDRNVDRPYIAVDSRSSPAKVYVSWIERPFARVLLAYSVDGGDNFSGPLELEPDTPGLVGFPVQAVGPNGEIYVAYFAERFTANPQIRVKKSPPPEVGINFVQTSSIAVKPKEAIRTAFSPRAPPVLSIAVDRGLGYLYLVWDDVRNQTDDQTSQEADVLFNVSRDGGVEWIPNPVRVNDATGPTDQFWPWIASPTSGTINVIFYDRRVDGIKVDVFYARSTDLLSFEHNVRVSDASFDPNQMKLSDCILNCDFMGDYIGMAAAIDSSGAVILQPVWTGTRDAYTGSQTTASRSDIFTERISQNDAGSGYDAGDAFATATRLPSTPPPYFGKLAPPLDGEDWYQFFAEAEKSISISMLEPTNIVIMDLYNPNGDYVKSCIQCSGPAGITGYWRLRVYNWSGNYKFSVTVYDPGNPGGGGGCGGPPGCVALSPYLSTYDGTGWHLDNNLLPQSLSLDRPYGTDVFDSYLVQKPLQSVGGRYALKIQELGWDVGYLDSVRMIAVDHGTGVSVGVSPFGRILTYQDPSPPSTAINSFGAELGSFIEAVDGVFYQGSTGDWVTAEFTGLDVSLGAKLVVRSASLERPSLVVQVWGSTGQWNNVTTLASRTFWSVELVDLTPYWPDAEGRLRLRLYLTASHRIDFIGLDTRPQAAIELREAILESAFFNGQTDVTTVLFVSDDQRVRSLPTEEVYLVFTDPGPVDSERNIIIIAEGYYEPLL